MSYTLKSLIIGYEVPYFEPIRVSELTNNINELFLPQIDVIRGKGTPQIDLIELPNTNYLFLFHVILKVSENFMTKTDLAEYLDSLQTSISLEMEDYLTSKEIMFNKIHLDKSSISMKED
jgi:hypothetical protein